MSNYETLDSLRLNGKPVNIPGRYIPIVKLFSWNYDRKSCRFWTKSYGGGYARRLTLDELVNKLREMEINTATRERLS